MIDLTKLSPDLAARCVIVAAYLYYVLDCPIRDDAEYDRLSQYVADNWDQLSEDRKWALESAEAIRSTGHHIKFPQAAVFAAYRQLADAGTAPKFAPPTDWKIDPQHGRYVTAMNKG